jgi:hypothetical protein
MAILRFRIYWEDDDSTYRDVAIRHSQNFAEFHEAILKCYEFDTKHNATFYRSNDKWQRGREISLENYPDKQYAVAPLIMSETVISTEVKSPNQRFIYVYDFNKLWTFLVELINVNKEENRKLTYPTCLRTEGLAPSQYGTRGLIDSRLAKAEEKYDLNELALDEGFSEEGEEGEEATTEPEEETSSNEGSDGF